MTREEADAAVIPLHRPAAASRTRRPAAQGGDYPADVRGLEEATDAHLMVGVGRYREEALAEVYRRHAGAVHALARRLLGEGFLAEEIVQEVFLFIWRHPERFDPGRGGLRSYLLALAHGRSIDLLRSEGARRRREARDAARRPADGPIEDEVIRGVVVVEEVRSAIGELPAPEREAIELAYFGGHTYREVADLLGEPEGTVKSRIRAGLRRMRGRLAEAGIDR